MSPADQLELAERQLMGRAPVDDVMRAYLAKGGRLLDRGAAGGGRKLVRNRMTGKILPCCWEDCFKAAHKTIALSVPHESPRWDGERRIYVFCSTGHRALYRASVGLPA